MNLRHIRYFIAVAEELHFSRAAKRLNISQPPLSQQIKELEGELNVSLFTRSRRRVELTSAGRALLQRAKPMIEDLDELPEIARRAERGEIGRISVGFIHTAGYVLLPAVIRAFRDIAPRVEVTLEQLGSVAQTAELERERIDAGFTWSAAVKDNMESCLLTRERFVVAMPRGHRLAGRKNASLAEFAGDAFVSFPQDRSPALHDAVIQLCTSAGFVPRIHHEADSVHTVLGLVAAGCGVGLVPSSAVQVSTRDVTFCMPRQKAPHAEISIQWRRGEISPVISSFVKTALRVRREIARDQVHGQSNGPLRSR